MNYDILFLNGKSIHAQPSPGRWGLTDLDGCHDGVNTFYIKKDVELDAPEGIDVAALFNEVVIDQEEISNQRDPIVTLTRTVTRRKEVVEVSDISPRSVREAT